MPERPLCVRSFRQVMSNLLSFRQVMSNLLPDAHYLAGNSLFLTGGRP